MTTTTTVNFNEFTNICKNIANDLNTMVEVKDYSKHGWAQVVFMTDKFGGTYAIFHFDTNTNEVKMQGLVKDTVIRNEEQLRMTVKFNLNKMLENRDITEIYERINDEY